MCHDLIQLEHCAAADANCEAPRATNVGPARAVTEYETVSELDRVTCLEGCVGWMDAGSKWPM